MKIFRVLLVAVVACFALRATADEAKHPAAMWVYETDAVMASPERVKELIEFCHRHDIVDLFWATHYARESGHAKISYQLRDPEPLRQFLAAANGEGLRVHALSGDPADTLPENHARVLARVAAIVAFNDAGTVTQRFAGIHFDIEPHALPAWKTATESEKCELLTHFVEVNAAAADLVHSRAPGLRYGADVVFWLDKQNVDGTPAYPVTFRGVPGDAAKHLLGLVDNLAIMSYRSFAEGQNGLIALTHRTVEQADHSHGRVFIGLKMANIGPPLETFYGQPESKMQAAVRAVDEAYASHCGYAGIAYFMYSAYRKMTRGEE